MSKDDDSDVRWAVAGNINTPIAVLIELSKDNDSDVRWAVAGNITYINYMKGCKMDIIKLKKFHSDLESMKISSSLSVKNKIYELQKEIEKEIGFNYVYGDKEDV